MRRFFVSILAVSLFLPGSGGVVSAFAALAAQGRLPARTALSPVIAPMRRAGVSAPILRALALPAAGAASVYATPEAGSAGMLPAPGAVRVEAAASPALAATSLGVRESLAAFSARPRGGESEKRLGQELEERLAGSSAAVRPSLAALPVLGTGSGSAALARGGPSSSALARASQQGNVSASAPRGDEPTAKQRLAGDALAYFGGGLPIFALQMWMFFSGHALEMMLGGGLLCAALWGRWVWRHNAGSPRGRLIQAIESGFLAAMFGTVFSSALIAQWAKAHYGSRIAAWLQRRAAREAARRKPDFASGVPRSIRAEGETLIMTLSLGRGNSALLATVRSEGDGFYVSMRPEALPVAHVPEREMSRLEVGDLWLCLRALMVQTRDIKNVELYMRLWDRAAKASGILP